MKKSKEVQIKYTKVLKRLLREVGKATFDMGNFLKSNGINKAYIYACEELGYIEQKGKSGLRITYKPCFNPERINDDAGRVVQNKMAEMRKEQKRRAALKLAREEHEKQNAQVEIPVNKESEEIALRSEIRQFIEEKFKEVGYEKKEVKETPLSERTSADLIAELQKRNFEGTLILLSEEKGIRKLETIEININKNEINI